MAKYQIAAFPDPYFTGELAEHSRGYRGAYRRKGDTRWIVCKEDRGAEGRVTMWQATPAQAKEYARKWLTRRLRRSAQRQAAAA